ncbi:MAG: hypothetical protein ABJM82_04500 [Shimia thalassica]|uniref:hypothetical protein n=1 Tax=Shimia thalassica TaxID=1715693 RepID=UPI0032970622
MKKSDAAYYCGMSASSFDRAVLAGEFPSGRVRTGGTFWLRNELEEAMLGKTRKPHTDFSAAI